MMGFQAKQTRAIKYLNDFIAAIRSIIPPDTLIQIAIGADETRTCWIRCEKAYYEIFAGQLVERHIGYYGDSDRVSVNKMGVEFWTMVDSESQPPKQVIQIQLPERGTPGVDHPIPVTATPRGEMDGVGQ